MRRPAACFCCGGSACRCDEGLYIVTEIYFIFVRHKIDREMNFSKTFLFAAAAAFMTACAGNSKTADVIGVDALAAGIEQMQDGDSVSVRGFCTDVCGHGSEHITLTGEDSVNAFNAIADLSLKSFDDGLKYQYVTVHGVLREQRVDSLFLQDWENRLDESLKGPNANPQAVEMLKGQIAWLRDSIASRYARTGKNYWSDYTISTYAYDVEQ